MARKLPETNKTNITIPSQGVPHTLFKDAMWIEMIPREISSQTTLSRGLPSLGKRGTIFKFIAPLEIAETQNHVWDEYDSLQKRLAEKVRDFAKIGEDAKALLKVGKNVVSEIYNPEGSARNLYNSLGGIAATGVVRAKVDAPLVYSNSERREFNITFQLVKITKKDDVVEAVKLIEQYASPESSGPGSIFYEPPYVFSIKSIPDKRVITIDYAALTSVQPTYHQPYIDGAPVRCDLTLTFKDMAPLFASAIEKAHLIKVKPYKSGPL